MTLRIGLATPADMWTKPIDDKRSTLEAVHAAGVDHLFMADHISFRDGSGTDGFVEVAGLSQLHDRLGVMISVYLLALRHPMTVARQMATMNKLAPGRFLLGVGVGGEDRHEIEVCGVDPTTRGRRTDESLEILNLLRPGNPVDYPGRFFHLDDAVIQPPLGAEIPIVIGGRSDAALRRTARFGHGWIGAWCSPRRFAEAVTSIDSTAAELGRTVSWLHGYQPWIGVGDSVDEARDRVATVMEDFYRVPFEMFERYTPMGTPADIVSALSPYVEAGCRMFNMKIVAGTEEASIEAAAEITADLRNVGGPA